MTFPEVLAVLTGIAKDWRKEEYLALDRGLPDVARDCRLRASAIEWAIEALEQKEQDQ